MFAQDNTPSAKTASGPKPSIKLYSIFALQNGREFKGEFATAKASHAFTFTPQVAKINQGRLELVGTFSLGAHKIPNITATLAATQGGIGAVPAKIQVRPVSTTPGLPTTESTGARGYVGTMYFKLSPLKPSTTGLTIAMNKVQLNVRLFPTSDLERELQFQYSEVVAALNSNDPEVSKNVAALNQSFSKR